MRDGMTKQEVINLLKIDTIQYKFYNNYHIEYLCF